MDASGHGNNARRLDWIYALAGELLTPLWFFAPANTAARLPNDLRDPLQEVRVFPYPAVADGIGLVVKMRRRKVGVDDAWGNPGEPHRKDLGRQVVDPDDGVEMMMVH